MESLYGMKPDPINSALATFPGLLSIKGLVKKALSRKEHCPECGGKRRLEVAMDLFMGKRQGACPLCLQTHAQLLQSLEALESPFQKRLLFNTLKGFLSFGLRKPFLPGAPRVLVWELTTQCNLSSCSHCYAGSGRDADGKALSHDEAKKAIERMAEAMVLAVAITGGESLLREDLSDLISHASSSGLATYLASNGLDLTQEKARELKKAGLSLVHVSLDGATPQSHDSFRGAPGLFQKAIEAIENCLSHDLMVCVATTATRANFREVPGIIDLCDALGVQWFILYNYVPMGKGSFELDLSPLERQEVLEALMDKATTCQRTRLTTSAPYLSFMMRDRGQEPLVSTHYLQLPHPRAHQGMVEVSSGCMAGKYHLAMKANGELTPCNFLPISLGHILQEPLEALWKESPILKALREEAPSEATLCGQCHHFEQCRGGCKARAYAYGEGLHGEDPGCPLRLSHALQEVG